MKSISQKILLLLTSFVLSFASLGIIDTGTAKAVATGETPVYRFFSKKSGAHLYTNSENEKNTVMGLTNEWVYEGPKYNVFSSQIEGTVAVHRFFNTEIGAHLYSTSETEVAQVKTLSKFKYEGIKYYVYSSVPSGNTALSSVHRFFNLKNGAHLFTTSEDEKNNIIATLSTTWRYEGNAFYAEPTSATSSFQSSNLNFRFDYPSELGAPVVNLYSAGTCEMNSQITDKYEVVDFTNITVFADNCSMGYGDGGGSEENTPVPVEEFVLQSLDGHSVTMSTIYWSNYPSEYIITGAYVPFSLGLMMFTGIAPSTSYQELKLEITTIVQSTSFTN